MEKLRADLASITDQFNQLTKTNETELDSFRHKLQNWVSLETNTKLDEIAQQLHDQFEKQKQCIPEKLDNHSQTVALPQQIHMATETARISYENHHTQIDPIDMIDDETQTESLQQLWSMVSCYNMTNFFFKVGKISHMFSNSFIFIEIIFTSMFFSFSSPMMILYSVQTTKTIIYWTISKKYHSYHHTNLRNVLIKNANKFYLKKIYRYHRIII